MSEYLPYEAMKMAFQAANTGGAIVNTDQVWAGSRKSGDQAQVVFRCFGATNDRYAARYSRYQVQIECYHHEQNTAETWAHAIFSHYDPLKGDGSNAPGLTVTGWRAEQVHPDEIGWVEALPITNGHLHKAVLTVELVNLSAI